jgi:hypothetical protein
MPMCPNGGCSFPTDCYTNAEQSGAQLGCGNTEIVITGSGACSYESNTARLRCR